MKKILLVCLVALLGIGSADAQKPKKGEKKSVTVEFVTNIDCEGCAKKVYNTIPYEKGVEDVKVDVATKIVTVTYNPAKTNNETLIKAFDKIKLEAAVAEGKCEVECCGEHKHEHKHIHEGECCGEHNHEHKHNHEQKKCEDDCCK
jgi:copper chaperone CopZ